MVSSNHGFIDGGQLIPVQWTNDSTTPDAPHDGPGVRAGRGTDGLLAWNRMNLR